MAEKYYEVKQALFPSTGPRIAPGTYISASAAKEQGIDVDVWVGHGVLAESNKTEAKEAEKALTEAEQAKADDEAAVQAALIKQGDDAEAEDAETEPR